MLKLYWLPTVNGAIELSKRNSSEAIVLLDTAAPYELGTPTNMSAVYPAYVRGQAYLLAHDGYAAAVEFQKLLDHRGVVQNFVTGSLAHLQLGRAYTAVTAAVRISAPDPKAKLSGIVLEVKGDLCPHFSGISKELTVTDGFLEARERVVFS